MKERRDNMANEFEGVSFDEKYKDEARVNPDLKRALDLLSKGGFAHAEGDLDKAIELYRDSIAYYPTADAHTYLGWMYSKQGRLEEAIEECHMAIEVDDEFGNPYNDIGCYLMQLGELDEAAEWLEKAKSAPRYEPRHFPYMNLGRIYLQRGRYGKAKGEIYEAIRQAPDVEGLKKSFLELVSLLH